MFRISISLFLCLFASLLPAFSTYAEPAKINDVYVIHLILDGGNLRMFNKVLDSGKLPAVEDLFVKQGAVFTSALSNFPSTSTTIYQSYTTGLLPGYSGIPHLERFDRKNQKVIGYLTTNGYLKINNDLINLKSLENPESAKLDPPTTIFELLDGHPTYALYSSFRKGASLYFPKRIPSHALWSAYVTDDGAKIDYLAYKKLFKILKRKIIPRYTLVGLYSVDFLGHEYGAESTEVEEALIQFDYFLRDLWKLLGERGIAEKTYLVVSSDHGMHDTGNLFKLDKPMRDAGIFVKPRNPKIKDYTLYAADRGISSTHIYVKHNWAWDPIEDAQVLRKHPKVGGGTVDLIDTMQKLDPTMLLIVRDGKSNARIFDTEGGESKIRCFNLNYTDWCSYRVEAGRNDPLKYQGNPKLKNVMDGAPHSTFEWRDATVAEEYPDAVIQLSQIFRDGRAGDFFVVPKSQWGFKKAKAATHGSIVSDDMRVVMMIRGPDVPQGNHGIIRSCDVFPLLLEWFGINIPKENYDGVNPFVKMPKESKEWQKLAALEQTISENPSAAKYAAKNSRSISALAKKEYDNRKRLLSKLEEIQEERQTDDHLDIIRRIINLTRERVDHMEKIVTYIR